MRDMTKNVDEAIWALTEKPLFATSFERIKIMKELASSHKDLPQPARFSRLFSMLLERVSLPLEDHDILAGRYIDKELNESEEAEYRAFLRDPERLYHRVFLSSGHATYSWEMLVDEGLTALRAKVLREAERCTDEDKKIFFLSIAEVYSAIISFMERYADEAEARGMIETAENLRGATARPESFASALQLLWIVAFINCAYITGNPTLTLGRLDRILYPLYLADIEKGVLTRERAKEYITDYYCKHNLIMGRGEHQVGDGENSTTFDRILNFDAPQYLMLAGSDENGNSAANELTELFCECIVPSFKNPVIVVSYVKDTDKSHPKLWRILCDKAVESASLMFYNDHNVISTLTHIGLPIEDARRYAHFGCNWCSAGDDSAWMRNAPDSRSYRVKLTDEEKRIADTPFMRANSPHSWPEDLMEILRELLASKGEGVTIDDIYGSLLARFSDFIDRKLSVASSELSYRRRAPSTALTYGDCFLRCAIESGECFSASAKYHFELQPFQMFGTVVDCLIAIDQLVMREKRLTLSRLIEATEANFEGFYDVLALCRKAEKYGSDTPLSNSHVRRLSSAICEIVSEKCRPYLEREGLFLMPCLQSDTWHLKYGEGFGATPDGRRANMPFSQNSRPSNGACTGGISAMFNSMLNLPYYAFASGALNLDIDPKQFEGESGRATFASLLASYFNRGGLHAQVSAAGLEELIDAKKNPELHRDLRVRVTGYSGIFVDFCERLQDDVIRRFE
jgi:formate C-acetyltransferase